MGICSDNRTVQSRSLPVFYDLTSSYFEGAGPALASWGYSKDHRPDCRQIQIGLLVNPDAQGEVCPRGDLLIA